ncbi:MAG TPA: hypothetical protein VF476_07005 [Chitinophagaceae bacterium]
MTKSKTGFWRGFTWKRFAGYTVLLLTINFLVALIFDYFDPEALVRDNFTAKAFIGLFIKSTFLGFLFALWFEPGVDKDRLMRNK